MGCGQLKVFLFKFSIHVGVVTICSVGIMLMATSLWINLVTPDPEIKTWASGVHWTVVSVFDVSGLGIYTLGMVAAYSESSRLANLLLIFLVLHGLLWLALTILSFGNWATINRAVCIDNRCADRLFIKNGNWRIAFDGDCENPSMERWLESAGHSHPMNEESRSRDNDGNVEMKRSLHPPRLDENDKEHHEIIKRLETLTRNVSSLEERMVALLKNRSAKGDRLRDVFWVSKFNKTLVHTPIGYIGCNATAHMVYSVICALLILAFWYIYPIAVVISYLGILKNMQQKPEAL